jgi:hypothetical protein
VWSESLTDAFDFAAHLHREQVRKGGQIAYLSHLLGVASLVLEWGGGENAVIAAFLHDAVEDQGGKATLAEIRQRFGSRVAELVEACSDSSSFPKPPWRRRKQAYVDRLATADPDMRLIVAADKLHNLRCILADFRRLGPGVWSRFQKGEEGTLWYYGAVLEKLSGRIPEAAEDELRRTLRELRGLVDRLESKPDDGGTTMDEQEKLRYPIGRFERGLSDPGSRAERIQTIASLPSELRQVLAGLSDEQLDTPYRPGGWSVRQLVHHLADSHANSALRFRLALTEEKPVIKPYKQDAWALLEDARTGPIEPSLMLLEGLHARWATLLRSLDSAQFDRVLVHPETGEITVDFLLQIYAWHSRHHLAHINGLKQRQGW